MVLQSVVLRLGSVTKRIGTVFALGLATALAIGMGAPATGHAQATTHYGSQKLIVNDVSNAYDGFQGIAVDKDGNLYVSDCGNAQEAYTDVCKETLQSDGTYVETVLFTNTNNGLKGPNYVAVDSSGNVYIADELNGRILKETLSGTTYTQSVVTDYAAGGLLAPAGIAVDSAGNVYVTDPDNSRVLKETLSGGTYTQSVIGSGFRNPVAVAVDTAGNVYIADDYTAQVYKETLSGGTYTQSVILNSDLLNFFDTAGLAVDNQGDVYVVNASGGGGGSDANTVIKAKPVGSGYLLEFVSTALQSPWAAAVDSKGNLYVTGSFNLVTEISFPPTSFGSVAVGTTSPVMSFPFTTGTDLPDAKSGATLSLGAPSEFTDVGTGTCDTNGTSHVYKAGETCTVDVTFTPKFAGLRSGAVEFVNASNVAAATAYISGTGLGPQAAFTPGTQSVVASGFTSPAGVAVDGNGTVYITDSSTNLILETPSGTTYTQSTLGIGTTTAQGLAVDGAGNVYFADSHNNDVTTEFYYEGKNDSSAILCDLQVGCGLNGPTGLTADLNGNIYIADTGNNRVLEEIYSSGNTYNSAYNYELQAVVAEGLSAPQAVAADSSGNVYIADTGNNRILKEAPVAGGTFTQTVLFDSGLSAPAGIAIDDFGNIYISDTGNKRVLKEAVSGSSYTQTVVPVTGLGAPKGLALDASANLYIADATNGNVLKLAFGASPSLTFASTAEGSTSSDSPQTVTLENIGTAPLAFAVPSTGSNPSISSSFTLNSMGSTACPLLTSSSSAATLAANATCTLAISFTPAVSGTISGSLVLTDNDLNTTAATQTVSLNGTATEAAAPIASLSPTTLAFGDVQIGSSSAALSTTLSNTGNATLNITGITLNDTTNFTEMTTCGSTLDAGKTCTISVKFTPAAGYPFNAMLSVADDAAGSPQTVSLSGTGTAAPVITETGNLWFNPAPVAIAAASAQTLTATFTLTGFSSIVTPTAKMHYGLAYKVGKVTCTGSAGNQTCTVPVTFIPNYPGGRKDALFLMNGTTRLATELAFGVGQSPFAMIQPGTVTNPISNNAHYLYDSVVDENGTVYVYLNSTVYSVTAAGVVTQLAVPGPDSNSDLSIDGAGVIYFGAPAAGANAFITYDTVQGVVSSVPAPVSALYFDGIASGNEGNIYMVDDDNKKLYTVKLDGTSTSLALTYDTPYSMVVDSNENLFATSGGSGNVDEITPAGVQTQVSTDGGTHLGIDAAATIYMNRYSNGVGELPASGYGTAVAVIDGGGGSTGNPSVAPDGTVYAGDGNNLDKVDRTQQTISFGEQTNGSPSQPAAFQVYNGGNENLTLATFAVTGEGFAIQSGTTNACAAGLTIAPGALCNAPIVFTGTHSGNFTGSIAFTSNTLNTTATSVSVPLSAYVNGIYVTVSPNPLSFGDQTVGTTSASKTVTFTNTGVNADANIGSPSSADGFTISQGTCTSNIAPGSSCSFNVTFSPTAVQAYTGTVNVTAGSDASTQSQSLSFTLSGTGKSAVTPPAPVAQLVFYPAILTQVAGSFTSGYTGDNGPATSAELSGPGGAVYDSAGNLYIADSYNNVVRKVDTTGKITTFAGNNTPGYSGDNGPATSAELSRPVGLAFDSAGNLYIADEFNNAVRMVTPGGTITTFAGNSSGTGGYTGDGGPATSATMNYPIGLAFDASGNLYIGDSANNVVRIVNTSGTINTFAGTGFGAPYSGGYTGDGGPAKSAELYDPQGVAVDPSGNVYIADTKNQVVRVVNTSGIINTFAGTGVKGNDSCTAGSAATACALVYPTGLAATPGGDVYISEIEGGLWVVNGTSIYQFERDQTTSLRSSSIGLADNLQATNGPAAVAVDSTGNVAVPNQDSNVVTGAGATGALNFGYQNVYTTSSPLYLQVMNTGSAKLTVSGTPTVTGPFAISGGTCDLTTGIPAGAICTLGVTFTPTTDGALTGSIALSSNGAIPSQTVQLTGTGQGTATLTSTLVPTSLTFTTQVNTTSAAQTSVFTNTGPAAITIDGIAVTANSGFAESDNCGTSVAVGAHCTISVTFSPTAATTYSSNVIVTSNSSSSGMSIALSGTGTPAAAPVASLSPTTLSFPSTTVGSTASSLSTTLSNTGNATLNISGITLTGTNTSDFAETTTCGSTLAAGKSCIISATFTPATVASYTASISVADNATGSPQTVSLSGTGTGGVTASPTSLNMGSETEYTENYTPQYITLTNNTSSTVTFSNFQSADVAEFYSQAYTCSDSGVLLANSSCELSVRFSPLSVGTITSSITMPYTGAGGGTLVVQLTGTGTAGIPAIDLYPLPINFGQLPVMTAATPITVGVEDTDTAPLTGIGISITGANAGDYTETDTCSGATVDPFPGTASCSITVNFTPTASGPRIAALNITSNGGAATFSTPLQGAGAIQPAQLQFSPTQLNLVAGAGGPCADATAGGLATAATFCNITGTAQDYLGNTYLVDNTYNAVYKVDTTGTISVFAGTPSKTGGYTGDNGPATSATLSGPTAVAADAFGNIYVSDTGNGAIREIDTTGMITSFLDGTCEDTGHGTPMHRATAAKTGKPHPHEVQLCEALQPEGLVVDSSGNLIFADTVNNVVLSVVIATGNFTLVAGDAEELTGIAGYNGDNRQADSAELNAPQDVAIDTAGNIYIADTLNYRIRKVTSSTGVITTVAGNGTQGDTGDTAAATSATINAYGVTTDLAGDIFIASGTGGIVRKVDASGNINLFAGGGTGAIGGPASTGAVANAYFARTDNSGDLLIPTGTQLLAAGPDGLLQFGSESVGTTTSALNVTLENTGDTPLTLGTTVATVTGTDAADFALTSSTCGYNLQPGKTCVLSVTFDPTATGARTASLSVPTNAAGSPQIVLLQGNGSAATAPAASLSPTTISFPDTTVGSTATAISTTLSNTGNATLNISGITITGTNPTDFAETTTCGSTLDAGKTCTISATFTPAAVASYTASISVADDATGSPQIATLSGNGTAAPAPIASLSPTTLTFPATTAGSTATALSTTLSNTGNATLNISGITLTGANPTDFAIATTGTSCGTTLAAGATCTIAATFTPAAAGSFTASISVADNAASSPQTATLTGTGNAAPATDFTLTATPSAQTVAPGAIANFTINTAGIGGDFDNAIQLTATGLPSGFTASFAPSSITPGANGASSVLSIQTAPLSALAQPHPLHRAPRAPWLAVLLVVPLLGLRKRFSKLRGVSFCLLLLASLAPVVMLTGCSGGYYNLQTKTYTVTVTGTSGSTQHSTTVTLTVQQ